MIGHHADALWRLLMEPGASPPHPEASAHAPAPGIDLPAAHPPAAWTAPAPAATPHPPAPSAAGASAPAAAAPAPAAPAPALGFDRVLGGQVGVHVRVSHVRVRQVRVRQVRVSQVRISHVRISHVRFERIWIGRCGAGPADHCGAGRDDGRRGSKKGEDEPASVDVLHCCSLSALSDGMRLLRRRGCTGAAWSSGHRAHAQHGCACVRFEVGYLVLAAQSSSWRSASSLAMPYFS